MEFYAVLILNRWFYKHFQQCGKLKNGDTTEFFTDFDDFLNKSKPYNFARKFTVYPVFFILIEFYAVLILNRWFYEHFQKCGYDFDEFLSA